MPYTDIFRPSKFAYTAKFRGFEIRPTRSDFEDRKITYTAIFFFFDSKCALHGHISRNSHLNAGEFKNWILANSKSLNSRVEMCPTRAHFEVSTRARKANFSLSRIRGLTRERVEMCPCRAHFGFKNEAKLQFWSFIFETEVSKMKLQILNSEFLKYLWIETELVQQWCSISPTLLNFRIFRKFDFSNFSKKSSKLNAVRENWPLRFYKIFDFTTCSFTVKSQF